MRKINGGQKCDYDLLCGHSIILRVPPNPGDILWCSSCRKFSYRAEYRVNCENCKLSKPMGQARIGAGITATKHHRKMPHHRVHVLYGRTLIETLEPNMAQLSFAENPDEPPY